jgi:hypothetical protein
MSGLADKDNVPSNWALGFCVSNFLAEVRDGQFDSAFERLFNGEGFFSEDGWELCRWPHRYLGADVASGYVGNGFLIWTDPEDYGYEPTWRIYEEGEFKRILAGCVQRHLASVVGAKEFESQILGAVAKFAAMT